MPLLSIDGAWPTMLSEHWWRCNHDFWARCTEMYEQVQSSGKCDEHYGALMKHNWDVGRWMATSWIRSINEWTWITLLGHSDDKEDDSNSTIDQVVEGRSNLLEEDWSFAQMYSCAQFGEHESNLLRTLSRHVRSQLWRRLLDTCWWSHFWFDSHTHSGFLAECGEPHNQQQL